MHALHWILTLIVCLIVLLIFSWKLLYLWLYTHFIPVNFMHFCFFFKCRTKLFRFILIKCTYTHFISVFCFILNLYTFYSCKIYSFYYRVVPIVPNHKVQILSLRKGKENKLINFNLFEKFCFPLKSRDYTLLSWLIARSVICIWWSTSVLGKH